MNILTVNVFGHSSHYSYQSFVHLLNQTFEKSIICVMTKIIKTTYRDNYNASSRMMAGTEKLITLLV